MTRFSSPPPRSPSRLPVRPLLLALALALPLLAPPAALAQEDQLPDAGSQGPAPSPDAGTDEPDEDTTGRIVEVCNVTADCSPRFACDNGRCRYQGTREANRVGCMFGPEATVALLGFGLLAGLRRRAS